MDSNLSHIDWPLLLDVLAAVVVLSFVVERALALVFEHRLYVEKLDKKGVCLPTSRAASTGSDRSPPRNNPRDTAYARRRQDGCVWRVVQRSDSPTGAADWIFAAWNSPDDALQLISDLRRGRSRAAPKLLEGWIWGIPAKQEISP